MDTKALRQKILDLAIRGKLVPQDPNDEPASVLLERIREQKQQMVKEGKLKKKDIKNDSVIFVGEDNLHYEKFTDGSVKCIEEEIPFEVPEGWAWSRFGSVVTLMSGTTYPAEKELISGSRLYVKVGDMNLPGNEYEISTSSRYLNEYNISHLVPVNSVIFPKRGGAIATNKKKLVLRDEILIDLNTMAFTPISPINLMYCYCWFLAIDLGKINSGSSVPQINNKDIEPLLFPVPPTFEQERIVQAIVPLLDVEQKISAAGVEITQIISRAKAKILDLAIRGQLVPQNPDDESVSVLLERIRAEKEELIKQGKIKRDKKESIIFKGEDNSYYEKIGCKTVNIDDEIPFDLPDSWLWCRGYSCFEGMESKKPQGKFFDYIDIDAINNRLHEIKEVKHLAVSDAPSRANRAVKNGSVLFSLVRPYLENIVLIEEKHSHCIASTGFYVCNSNGVFLPEFMFYLMISGYVVGGLNRYMKGDNSPSISKDNIEGWLYPVPPVEEQKMICTNLQAVFTLIESVEKSLS
ncbi:restriction endonuclease subunit S [Ruminococcus gauvreauii]|uniref:Restriction endonuclease subunit S n=1 Tax=Ruminococcus gauvreauii TaxID=438033 RepID=A0ABY5VBT1_9FIRM|nr:restriction endonuclease subunit S [Ruminococcus gauvreauii]UWP58007.1 restriction endonuclease subunit S [Ruminococcus gauvreauii]